MDSLRGKLTFSIANTAAVLVALYIAFARDLERPYWAMFTVFIIAKPVSGIVRSKAVYRLAGSVIGAAVSVFLIPPLVHAPTLLCLAISAWVGGCLYVALLDRTPRSYAFMLAGYTATIVGLSVVNTPEAIFDTAVSRIEEISLGILCGSLAHSLFFPTSIATILNEQIERTIRNCGKGLVEALARQTPDVDAQSQQRLATSVIELHLLYTHVAYDTSDVPRSAAVMRMLQDRLAMLLPSLSNAQAALEKLRAAGGPRAPLVALLKSLSAWAQSVARQGVSSNTASPAYTDVKAQVAALPTHDASKPESRWQDLLEQTVITNLADVAAALEESRQLAFALKNPEAPMPQLETERPSGGGRALHRDRGLALLSACAAAGATLLGCLLWIAGSWPEGAVAAQFAAIGCSLFATFDDPAKVIKAAIIGVLVSLVFGAAYEFAIIPRIDGFASLALVLSPMLLLFSFMQTSEKLEGAALVLAIGFSGSLALQTTYKADFAAFINSNAAEIAGLLLALVTNLLFRTIEPVWNARRISRAGWHAVSQLALERRIDLKAWMLQMLDRLGLVATRLTGAPAGTRQNIDGLRDMRVGLNLAALRAACGSDNSSARPSLKPVLDVVAQTYEAWRRNQTPPRAEIAAHSIDAGICALSSQARSSERTRGLIALTSLRLDFAPTLAVDAPLTPTL